MPKLLLALILVIFLIPQAVLADASFTYKVSDANAKSGDIVANAAAKGFALDGVAYDSHVFGVIQDDPLAVYRTQTTDPTIRPIVTTGNTVVNVTDYNGKILAGDYVASSPVSGKGMKAGQSGYVIGIATEDAIFGKDTSSIDGKQVTSGQVTVAMRIEFAELTTARSNIRLLDNLNAAFFRSVQNPEKFTLAIRYIIAGLIAIVAFIIGFFAFTRSISKGIEAMGRNPLARRSIQAGIIIQVVLTVLTSLGAIILAFIIIRL